MPPLRPFGAITNVCKSWIHKPLEGHFLPWAVSLWDKIFIDLFSFRKLSTKYKHTVVTHNRSHEQPQKTLILINLIDWSACLTYSSLWRHYHYHNQKWPINCFIYDWITNQLVILSHHASKLGYIRFDSSRSSEVVWNHEIVFLEKVKIFSWKSPFVSICGILEWKVLSSPPRILYPTSLPCRYYLTKEVIFNFCRYENYLQFRQESV